MRDRLEFLNLLLMLLTTALDLLQRLAEWWPFCVL